MTLAGAVTGQADSVAVVALVVTVTVFLLLLPLHHGQREQGSRHSVQAVQTEVCCPLGLSPRSLMRCHPFTAATYR